VAENNAQTIKDFVNNIKLHDGTATHIGMKYGLALLNPSSRDEFGLLHTAGVVDEKYKFRPANFDDNVVKYIVVMSDGQITSQLRPKNAKYSDIYDENLNSSGRKAVFDRYGSVDGDGDINPASNVEQGYPSTNTFKDTNGTTHNENKNVANFKKICDLAKQPVTMPNGEVKDDRVTVYSISFFAPTDAANDMKSCASSPSHYWKDDIGTAFNAIARTISELRLTQ
jgi:hypothetical protein